MVKLSAEVLREVIRNCFHLMPFDNLIRHFSDLPPRRHGSPAWVLWCWQREVGSPAAFCTGGEAKLSLTTVLPLSAGSALGYVALGEGQH